LLFSQCRQPQPVSWVVDTSVWMGPSAIVLDRFAADSEHDRGGDKRMLPRTGGFKRIFGEGDVIINNVNSIYIAKSYLKTIRQ